MLEPIINLLTNILVWVYDILGNNFGLAIIVFTVLIRLATAPLTKAQLESSKKMQELQGSKKYQDMQKKYKSDPQKLQQEQAKLFQEMGINPFAGCLPTLVQFPIIIGLYWSITRVLAASPHQMLVLMNALKLPNAAQLLPIENHFLWMDLSQPERLVLDFIPASFPLLGAGIPVLAILVWLTSYLQSKMMAPASNNPNDQTAAMTRSMTTIMPLMIAYITFLYSAGLGLYFLAGNLFSIAQYALMGKLDIKKLIPGRAGK